MRDRCYDREDLEFVVGDATRLPGAGETDNVGAGAGAGTAVSSATGEDWSECCALVLDKALLDSQLCGADALTSASGVVSEAYRVLKKGGFMVVVSHGRPDARVPLLQQQQLTGGSGAGDGVSAVRCCVSKQG